MKKIIAIGLLSIAAINVGQSFAADSEITSSKGMAFSTLAVGKRDGVVFAKLKQFTAESDGKTFDILDISSSSEITDAQKKQATDAINKGITVIIDGPLGNHTAAKTLNDIFGFSIDAEAIVVKKTSDGNGLSATPIDGAALVYKQSTKSETGDTITNNSVENVFEDLRGNRS